MDTSLAHQPPAETPVPGIDSLKNQHHGMINWLIANPAGTQRELAAHFKYTEAWISCIIHSDAFQEELNKRRAEVANAIVADVPTKLKAVASMALDGLASAVAEAAKSAQPIIHREFLKDSAEMALKSLGFGGKGTIVVNQNNTQNNFTVQNRGALVEARTLLIQKQAEYPEPPPPPPPSQEVMDAQLLELKA